MNKTLGLFINCTQPQYFFIYLYLCIYKYIYIYIYICIYIYIYNMNERVKSNCIIHFVLFILWSFLSSFDQRSQRGEKILIYFVWLDFMAYQP